MMRQYPTEPAAKRISAQHGFTLVEAIMVIVLTGIIAAMVARFIVSPVQGYVDSVARAELTDTADTALRRMTRDIRLALPNSVRVNADGTYMEMLLTKTGARYLSEQDSPISGSILDFENSGKLSFDVAGPMPAGPLGTQAIAAGDWIVVYNLGPGFAPANAYGGCPAACNRAQVAGVAGNTITLTTNPFAGQVPRFESPDHRFQVVTTPVTYACTGGNLMRYWDYPIQLGQPGNVAAAPLSNNGTSHALLAAGVNACNFSYQTLASSHAGLIGVRLTLESVDTNSGLVTLVQQVHVDNTP